MKTTITAKLIRIGNSRGIRLPKELIEQAGLQDELELTVRDGEILIANHRHPRAGWAEAMEVAYQRGELELTQEDWEWVNTPHLPEEEADWEWK